MFFNLFCSLYNHIRQVSELTQGNDYMLFKFGIQPTWEDKANKGGGRWLVNIDNKQKNGINELWLNLGSNYYTYGEKKKPDSFIFNAKFMC